MLENANLVRAQLMSADLTDAELRGANLTGAILRETNLTGADFTGANLTRIDLTGADLRAADLWGTVGGDFTDAIQGLRWPFSIVSVTDVSVTEMRHAAGLSPDAPNRL